MTTITMEKRQLGKTDMQVSVLGYGGAEIGFEKTSLDTMNELLASAIDAGLNVIDTASAYNDSEALIGQALGSRRKEVFLFTKCGWTDGFKRADWSPTGIQKQLEQSLKNLRTDYVDLFQLHSCDISELRKGDVIDALRRARDKGYTRYIGYSGDGQAAKFAIESGAFDTLQTSLNILDQEPIELTLPMARQKGMGVIAKRPIANVVWRTGQKPTTEYHHPYWERHQKLKYEFLRAGDPKAISLALRFTLSQPGVHVAIVGTRQPGRWRENAELLQEGPLSSTEIERIRTRWIEVTDATWTGQT